MRSSTLALALLTVATLPLAAQKKTGAAPKQAGKAAAVHAPAAAVGTWTGKTMTGPKDSVVATFTMTVNADGTGTLLLPDRDPVVTHLTAAGGDSIVAVSARYKSVTRPGVTVVNRTTLHVKGNTMSGTNHADFSDGVSRDMKTTATRKK